MVGPNEVKLLITTYAFIEAEKLRAEADVLDVFKDVQTAEYKKAEALRKRATKIQNSAKTLIDKLYLK